MTKAAQRILKLKRHHYILGGFGIVAIIALVGIFGFQMIDVKADGRVATSGLSCQIEDDAVDREISVGEQGILKITCSGSEADLKEDLELTDIKYDENLVDIKLAVENELIGAEEDADNSTVFMKTYVIYYIGKATGEDIEIGLKREDGEGNPRTATSTVSVVNISDAQTGCQIYPSTGNFYLRETKSGVIECRHTNDITNPNLLTGGGLKYDTNIIEITGNWAQTGIYKNEELIGYKYEFQYYGTGRGTTTIQITGDVANSLGLSEPYPQSKTIEVEGATCSLDLSKTNLSVGESGQAIMSCTGMTRVNLQQILKYSGDVLRISDEISTTVFKTERASTTTFDYLGIGLGSTTFDISDEIGYIKFTDTKGIVSVTGNCKMEIQDGIVQQNHQGSVIVICPGSTWEDLQVSGLSYEDDIIIVNGGNIGGEIINQNGLAYTRYIINFMGKYPGSTFFTINEGAISNGSVTNNEMSLDDGILVLNSNRLECSRGSGMPSVISVNQTGYIELTCPPQVSIVEAMNIVENVFVTTGGVLEFTGNYWDRPYKFSYTGHSIGQTSFSTSGILLNGGIYLNVTGSEIIEVTGESLSDSGCTWGEPDPNPILVGSGASIKLTCTNFEYIADNNHEIWSAVQFIPEANSGVIRTGYAEILTGIGAIFHYTGNRAGEVQLTVSGDVAGYHYHVTDPSLAIKVEDNGNTPQGGELKLELNPDGSDWTNNSIDVHMEGRNANRVKYYTGTESIGFNLCQEEGRSLPGLNLEFQGTVLIDTEGTTYLSLCGGGIDGNTGLVEGIYRIDTTQPTFDLDTNVVNKYECETGTIRIINVSGGLSGLPTNAYIWNGITGSSLVFSKYSATSGTQTVSVKITDGAGNVSNTQSATIIWSDALLRTTTGVVELGVINGTTVMDNVIDDFGVQAGSCEIISSEVVDSSHAECTPRNGYQLIITPDSNYNGEGYCKIEFTDGDTTKYGRYTFNVNTITGGPNCNITYTPGSGSLTNQDVTGTISCEGINVSNNTHVFTGNGEFPFEVVDSSNQVRIFTGKVTRIDKDKPLCKITATEPMDGHVSLTLSFSGEAHPSTTGYSWDGVNYSSNSGRTVGVNGVYTGYVKDLAGNTGNCSINVNNITVMAPTVSATNSSTEWKTGDNISITMYATGTNLVGSKYIVGSATSSFDSCRTNGIPYTNGSGLLWSTEGIGYLTLCAQNQNGNTGYWTGIYKLDKRNPNGEILTTYLSGRLPNGCTSGNVVLILSGSDGNGLAASAYKRNDGAWTPNNTKTISVNESGTGYIRDIAGNIISIPYTITGISSGGPEIHLTYPMNGYISTGNVYFVWNADGTTCQSIVSGYDVIVYSGASEVTTLHTNNLSYDYNSIYHDGTYTWKVKATDILGYTTVSEVRSFVIKSGASMCNIVYTPASGHKTSGDVLAVLTGCTEGTTGFNKTGVVFTGNGQFVFTFRNELGITGNAIAIVNWIDKDAPVLLEVTPVPSPTTDTTPNYTFSSSESGSIIYSGSCSSVTTGAKSGDNTVTFNELKLGTYSDCVILVVDEVGNKSEPLQVSQFVITSESQNGSERDYCPDGDYSDNFFDGTCKGSHKSDEIRDLCKIDQSNYPDEMKLAYLYSYMHEMTTMCPIDNANLYGYLRRDHLAKILSQYAVNVLGLVPEKGKAGCDAYNDIAKSSNEMKGYMKTACELHLMGMESDGDTPMKSFYPHGLVTRAEFGTTLSRLIYGDKYNLESEAENTYPGAWYSKHLAALKRDEIMNEIYGDRPQHFELRGYVMLMVMRHGKSRLNNVSSDVNKNVITGANSDSEILSLYNKNKELTCDIYYYDATEGYGSGTLYMKDNKFRENLSTNKEGKSYIIFKNNMLYMRGDEMGTGKGLSLEYETTAREELDALLDDDAYTFKNCKSSVQSDSVFTVPSNIKFVSMGDRFDMLGEYLQNLTTAQ